MALILLAMFHAPAYGSSRGITVKARTRSGTYKNIDLYTGYHALVVGCGDYRSGWPKLRHAVDDAKEVTKTLRKMGWSVDLLTDPDYDHLRSALNKLITGLGKQKNQAILFWFSGHGHTLVEADGLKLGYLVPVNAPNPDTDEFGFMENAISMRYMETVTKRIQSKHVLMLFDSCFSGAIFQMVRGKPSAYIQEKLAEPVRQFITAGNENEQVPDRSVFKDVFIQALQKGYADRNNDGYMTGEELGVYLQEKVVNYSRKAQHPQFGKINNPKLDKGDFVFELTAESDSIMDRKASSPAIKTDHDQIPAQSAFLSVECNTDDASVYVDDRYIGTTVLADTAILPGNHMVRVEKKGYEPYRREIQFMSGRSRSLFVVLAKIKTATSENSHLYIETIPKETQIRILNIGPKFYQGMELSPGQYHLEISGSGYITKTFWTELKAREEKTLDIELQPASSSAAASGKTWQDPVTGMEFVWVPAGCYKMGCSSWRDNCGYDENPLHEVCLDGFYMGKYEVTQGQWQKIMNNNPSYFGGCGENCPVERVSWEQVQVFIDKLNKKSGQKMFRLPTEAEWEYACRSGGKNQKYCGGNNWNKLAWAYVNSDNTTHPVGQKTPNGIGLYDMSGNVWEWCEDIYDNLAYKKHSRKNPIYNETGSQRIIRGGSWYNEDENLRAANRRRSAPSNQQDYLGFRIVRIP